MPVLDNKIQYLFLYQLVSYQLVLEQPALGTIDGDDFAHGSKGGGIGEGV